MKSFYLYLLFLLAFVSLEAQVNFKIGYELDYFNSSAQSCIVDQYNEEFSFLENGEFMPSLRFMNGVNLGVSYRTRFSRIELGWHLISRERDAFGTIEATDSTATQAYDLGIRYRRSGFQLGYEFIIQKFGIGATLNRDVFSMATKGSPIKVFSRQPTYTTQFHISYQLYQSDRISLVLRPYYTLFYEELNFEPLISEMNISPIKSTVGDVPYSFGLTVIFYNGTQESY